MVLEALVYPALVFALVALGQVTALKREVERLKAQVEEIAKK
jgi:AmiR/NasT family two-component response regulator